MIKRIVLHLVCAVLRLVYLPMKLFPTREKVVYLSRQDDVPGLDFQWLAEELRRTAPQLRQVMLCKKIERGPVGKVRYGLHMLRQMYHLATAEIAILDGYCIAACLLHHKKSLHIYQIWHAMGLMKSFGYASVGTAEGSDPDTARIMRMHRGYHRIFCSSAPLMAPLAACYGAPVERMMPIGMPRIDFLTDPARQDACRQQIFADYPVLQNGKPVVLFVPTFRKNKSDPEQYAEQLVDLSRYNLIVKGHDGSERVLADGQTYTQPANRTGMEMLAAADYVITDYSAILFEALTAGKPVIRFCYDYEEYCKNRGFSGDFAAIPAPLCTTTEQVQAALEHFPGNTEAVQSYLDTNVSARIFHCTKAIVTVMLKDRLGEDVSYEALLQDASLRKEP